MCISPLHVASTHAHGRLPSTHAAAERPAGAGVTLLAPLDATVRAHLQSCVLRCTAAAHGEITQSLTAAHRCARGAERGDRRNQRRRTLLGVDYIRPHTSTAGRKQSR